MANDTEFGLAAYVFTRDEARAQRVIAGLQFQHIGWNTGSGPTPEAPFGGIKQSGFGREGGAEESVVAPGPILYEFHYLGVRRAIGAPAPDETAD
jgi:hypothetical protein